jgi:hypothetical protein
MDIRNQVSTNKCKSIRRDFTVVCFLCIAKIRVDNTVFEYKWQLCQSRGDGAAVAVQQDEIHEHT